MFLVLDVAFALALGSPAARAALVSKAAVERQADLAFRQMKARLPISRDAEARAYVQCVAQSIIARLDEPYRSLDWEIELFQHSAANAFAMPGGKIGVFTGIFRVTDGQDSLAAVIGHEVAHVIADDSLKRARRKVRNQLLVIVATEALGGRRGTSDVLGMGAELGLNLPYDRKQEARADSEGLRLMSQAGFDPRASIGLWKTMSRQNRQNPASPPEFLSTHPSADDRIDRLIAQLARSLVVYNEANSLGHVPQCVK